jgi:hypothetical protein
MYLDAMGESPLNAAGAHGEYYRLLHIGRYLVTAVRVDLSDNACVVAKVIGPPRGTIHQPVYDATRALSHAEADELRRMVDAALFWRLSSEFTRQGLDGAFWNLEGFRDSEHRVVYRWSPNEAERDYLRLCEYMLEIAPRVNIPEPTPEERAERERRHDERETQRAATDKQRAEARRLSNDHARVLHGAMKQGRALICPHCGFSTTAMRYVERREDSESYFVCDRCKRSSSGSEVAAATG